MKCLCLILLGYMTTISYSQSETFKLTDTISTLGATCTTWDLTWNLGSETLDSSSYKTIDSIYVFITKNPKIVLELGNHYDSETAYRERIRSRNLSRGRAESVIDYLVAKGINKNRLIPRGYGNGKPLVTNVEIKLLQEDEEIESTHKKNRRFELTIIHIISN